MSKLIRRIAISQRPKENKAKGKQPTLTGFTSTAAVSTFFPSFLDFFEALLSALTTAAAATGASVLGALAIICYRSFCYMGGMERRKM